jgi:hypothetical protein
VKSVGQRLLVSKRFPGPGFDKPPTSFHFAHQHRVLNRGDTEVSQPILSATRPADPVLFDEEGAQLILHDLKEMAEVLPDELAVVRHPVSDSSKWSGPRHAKNFSSTASASAIWMSIFGLWRNCWGTKGGSRQARAESRLGSAAGAGMTGKSARGAGPAN